MISGERIKLHEFDCLRGGCIPFVHDIVVSDATLIEKSTWLARWRMTMRLKCKCLSVWGCFQRV